MHKIVVKNARTNNLKNISIEIPHNQLIAVTGISGSGKSSLAFDVIAREGQRRYFETMPGFARQFLGKLNQPDVDSIEGLSPVIAIQQKTTSSNARSTVGTMSDLYDLLRLLYARFGETNEDILLTRSLFSFNSEIGQCPQCRGIGKEEKIDVQKLVADPSKTLREGALAPTLPNGYIMYSQVTIDVLNQVCEAEGFNVNIPWNDLSEEQKNVILYGSDKIKVPFGKHSIESRLKWTGIKAKPREEGHYKGMMPIMSDILRRDRNANILKYVSAVTCSACDGKRLNPEALAVRLNEVGITDLAAMEISEVSQWLSRNEWRKEALGIIEKLQEKINLMRDLGLGHLRIDQPVIELSASEAQRIRVINQLTAPLSDVLYVLDEPSIGLHPEENYKMVEHLRRLVQKGNTVIVVEHDLDTIRSADWIIDIGPKAGSEGGNDLFNGPLSDFVAREITESPTNRALKKKSTLSVRTSHSGDTFSLLGCTKDNLKNIDVSFQLEALNIVSGKSGSGVRALVLDTLKNHFDTAEPTPDHTLEYSPLAKKKLDQCIFVDQSPIGRTPRSNPATYLGISDAIRDLFASLPAAKSVGFTKSRFSFNNKGGRCETCQGAGKIQIGMHFLGTIDLKCGTCGGKRFNEETLKITYQNKSIAEIYALSINEALNLFDSSNPSKTSAKILTKIRKGLQILQEIGLGYLSLGQSSTTLSGGEAQRIKIANQLQKKSSGKSLYVLMEPSIGLHHADIETLLHMFDRIKAAGNTIVCAEQDERIIAAADWHIELGPEGGKKGGELMYQGVPKMLQNNSRIPQLVVPENQISNRSNSIELHKVSTNGLKNIDVKIPKEKLTVVTGVSGSGKSSLVYDTLFSEANARFSESLSIYNRSLVQQNSTAKLESFSGMTPAIALPRRSKQNNKRSTVGTITGIYDHFRLLFARIAGELQPEISAQHFSFNHHLGACEHCKGLGVVERSDPFKIIEHPDKSILDGALSSAAGLKYYANPDGQFIATLKTIAEKRKWNLEQPWNALSESVQHTILLGTGEESWDVIWNFKNKSRSGVQELKTTWLGFCGYIDDEFERKRQNKNIRTLEELMHDVECPICNGSRLKKSLLETKFLGKNIAEWSSMSLIQMHEEMKGVEALNDPRTQAIAAKVLPETVTQIDVLKSLGLSYLNLDRGIGTLSGGECQRVLLAGQFATNLHGVTYVLDEPTIGLDRAQILVIEELLRKIIAKGNTVVVVEHDPEFIRLSDYVIELGPGAGKNGGEVVYQGPLDQLKSNKSADHSKTLELLNSEPPTSIIESTASGSFTIKKAHANNLKHIDVTFNLGTFTVISGVSGSGKSSLMRDVLYASTQRKRPVNCEDIEGSDLYDEVDTIYLDQNPVATTRQMTPASYLSILDALQIIFSKIPEAKKEGLKKADFSYSSKKGKCPTCNGNGKIQTSLDFMSDVWSDCDSCNGKRYHLDLEKIKWKGYSIGSLLQLTVNELKNIVDDKKISKPLEIASDLGLGHLVLGQSANTLSVGEAQRLKLTRVLLTKTNLPHLFLMDEPSTGLHYTDLTKLLKVFERVIQNGDTIICIDHNQQILNSANKVITIGPGSGDLGGALV